MLVKFLDICFFQSVHTLITSELTRVSRIALAGEPRHEDGGRPGWGKPGIMYYGLFNTEFSLY